MIIVNRKAEKATNTATGATCDIILRRGEPYTDMAGIVALEVGVFVSDQLRNIIKQRQRRKSADLLKPIKINSSWWYSVEGWNALRDEILANIESGD